ncbi:MAG: glutamate--tRNA ligase [Syntrophales bacterium]|nr:glutamate--tRNA ligase [Syntrophales bacterium]
MTGNDKSGQAVRVRFAPSPTGELHVGNARTALFNYLFARRQGGHFVLRMEDTDAERASQLYEAHIMEDLLWLGLPWDEGPDRGGPEGPYRQSERFAIYHKQLAQLIEGGFVYPCYCTDEELDLQRREMMARHEPPRYPGTCRRLTDGERALREREGRRPAWRFAVPPETVVFRDMIRGNVRFAGTALGDFIVMRSNGAPAYNFACVVDDHLMKITHVIRGEDHLSNTALQLFLYRALHWKPPTFAHHALILGRDRAKFSKRHGDVAVREYRERGILPEALVNYLALLGASLGGGKEVASLAEIVASFELSQAGKSGAVFDDGKLRWLNGLYLRRVGKGELAVHLEPFIKKAGYDPAQERVRAIVASVQDNLTTLADIGDYLAMFDDGRFALDEEARVVLADPQARSVVAALQRILDEGDGKELPPYGVLIDILVQRTGKRGRDLYLPLRAALTGRVWGPELDKVFFILDRGSIMGRLARALSSPVAQ